MTKLDRITRQLKEGVEYADHRLAEFPARFAENPAYALEWSHVYYGDAAKREVYRALLAVLEKAEGSEEEKLAALKEHATKKALNRARKVGSSTSATSNLMEDSLRAAWAETLTGFFRLFG